MITPEPLAALKICPLRAAGEEIDCAIEFTRSVVDMALDLGDVEWATKAGKTHALLVALRDGAGIGRRPRA